MSTAVFAIDKSKGLVGKLARLPSQKSRREFLRTNRTRLDLQVVVQLADRARKLLRVDARKSLALSEIAIDAARLLDDALAMAHAVRIKANAKYALGDHRAALKLYERAVRSFEALGEKTELGRTLSVSILSLNLCGEYKAAFVAAERARSIFTELKDELRLARLDINFGNIYYRQDNFSKALDCYRRAYRVLLDYHDPEGTKLAIVDRRLPLSRKL